VADDWHGASLRALVEQQMSAYADRFGGQIAIDGEDIMLKPETVQNLGLALHELATNAQKYGALPSDSGRVCIHWQVCDAAKVVSRALAGEVKLSFPAKGVCCVIVIPSAQVASRD